MLHRRLQSKSPIGLGSMDDRLTTIDLIKQDMALAELDRTIQYARIRCLSRAKIIERIATLDEVDDTSIYVHRLFELELDESDLERLVEAMDSLAVRSEAAPPARTSPTV